MELKGQTIFIPHGGGPLPILGHQGHKLLINFFKSLSKNLIKPSLIILISAHWEEEIVTITSSDNPKLIYDYYGFPDESYNIEYPALGNKEYSIKIKNVLEKHNIKAKLDEERGFDHGMFIPLKLIFPDASIPCVQISLLKSLDPKKHIEIGKALKKLENENILFIGSGMSFHNLKVFLSNKEIDKFTEKKIIDFDNWLVKTCTDNNLDENEREQKILNWEKAPFARFCHPREEHLLPLHVCAGIGSSKAKLIYNDEIMSAKCSAFLW